MVKQWVICEDDQLNELKTKAEQAFPIMQKSVKRNTVTELFKALGDETRLQIIGLLQAQDMCLCEITAALEAASSTITHHLKLLERANVINSRREGKFTVYHLVDPAMIQQLVATAQKEGI